MTISHQEALQALEDGSVLLVARSAFASETELRQAYPPKEDDHDWAENAKPWYQNRRHLYVICLANDGSGHYMTSSAEPDKTTERWTLKFCSETDSLTLLDIDCVLSVDHWNSYQTTAIILSKDSYPRSNMIPTIQLFRQNLQPCIYSIDAETGYDCQTGTRDVLQTANPDIDAKALELPSRTDILAYKSTQTVCLALKQCAGNSIIQSFADKVANTGMYVMLCKARVLLFPDRYVHTPGQRFLERRPTRAQSIILKDGVLIEMLRLLVTKYKTEFRDLEHKYFGNTWLFDAFQSETSLQTGLGEAIMEKDLLLTILTREKFFRKQASQLIKHHGIQHILILGSGLDTFALRKEKYTHEFGVTFFEFDRAEPLRLKQELFQELYGRTNATYVSGSYLETNWLENLQKAGLNPHKSTLVIWGGNTMYLTKTNIASIMTQLNATFPKETKLFMTFDYLHPAAINMSDAAVADQTHNGRLLQNMLEGFKRAFNIQFSSGFTPAELPDFCSNLGFSIWSNQHTTASEHVKSTLQVDETPVYTEEYYSYATVYRH